MVTCPEMSNVTAVIVLVRRVAPAGAPGRGATTKVFGGGVPQTLSSVDPFLVKPGNGSVVDTIPEPVNVTVAAVDISGIARTDRRIIFIITLGSAVNWLCNKNPSPYPTNVIAQSHLHGHQAL